MTELIANLKAEAKAEMTDGPIVDGKIQYKIKIRRSYYDKKGRHLFDIDEGFEEKNWSCLEDGVQQNLPAALAAVP